MPFANSYPLTEQDELSLIVTDSRSLGLALQQALSRLLSGEQHVQVVNWDQAAAAVQKHGTIVRRVILSLGSDVARGLGHIRQLRELTTRPLMVIGPRDAGLILDALHAGASDFVEDSDPIDERLAQALARHRPSDTAGSPPGKTIAVASVRGGAGSSLIAVNLAAAFSKQSTRAALCDLDLVGGVCDSLLNLKPKHTILDLERCLDRLDRNSLEQALTPHACGLQLLAAPSTATDHRIDRGELFPRVLRTLRQMFPIVVADASRLPTSVDPQTLIANCDELVLVTQLDFNSVRSAHRVLDHLDHAGLPADRIHVVWNRHGQPNELAASKGELALNRRRAHLIPDDPKIVNRSINCGTPFVLDAPDSRVAKTLAALADVIGRPEQPNTISTAERSASPSPVSARGGGWQALVSAAFGRMRAAEFAG